MYRQKKPKKTQRLPTLGVTVTFGPITCFFLKNSVMDGIAILKKVSL
jgi:hypothetical protein